MESSNNIAVINALSSSLRKDIDSGDIDLPILPRIAGQILTLTNDPNAEISTFSKLIHTDQALASHVLRIANSAAYSSGDQVVSLQQAIARLGMKLLADIAMAVSIQATKNFTAEGYEVQQNLYTQHALLSGLYGKEIARMKRRNVEGQFLCGLLHSVGKPVLLSLVIEQSKKLEVQISWSIIENLIEEFYFEVGKRMTSDWNLPSLIDVTSKHYKDYKSSPSFQEETAITYLSDFLATWIQQEKAPSIEDLKEDPVFVYLNFYPDEVEQILEKKEKILEFAQQMQI